MNDELALLKQLDALKAQHRSIDARIEDIPDYDQFAQARLKREKLQLRDEIIAIESELYPDIIA